MLGIAVGPAIGISPAHTDSASFLAAEAAVEHDSLNTYNADAAALQSILAPHCLAEVNQADRQNDIKQGQLLQAVFNRHFQLPRLPDDVMYPRGLQIV